MEWMRLSEKLKKKNLRENKSRFLRQPYEEMDQ